MTNLEFFNDICEKNISAEDTALGMVLSVLKEDIFMERFNVDDDEYEDYIKRYHYLLKWLDEEKV